MSKGSLLLLSADPGYVASFLAQPNERVSRAASTLAEVTALAAAFAFDAVVVDVDLEGARDLPLISAVRERCPLSAVVALVGGDAEGVAFEAMRLGAEDCLSKQEERATVHRAATRAVDRMWLRGSFERREQLLESAFAALSPKIAVVDEHGVIVLTNRSWERHAAASVGAAYLDVLPRLASSELDRARVRQGFERVLAGELAHSTSEYSQETVGGRRWYLQQVDRMPGAESGVVITDTDITERRSMEEALRRSEADFRTLLQSFPQGLGIHRLGTLVWINGAALESLGYDAPDELLGRSVLEFVHPDDHALVISRMQRAFAGEPNPPMDQRLLTKSGKIVLAEVTAVPIHFEGEPAVLVMGIDAVQRRQFTAQLLQVDRMHSVGLLALGLGHEINNPLSLVTANVDVAYRRAGELQRLAEGPSAAKMDPRALEAVFELIDGARELREAIGEARQGARRVQEIVGELRTFSRSEEELIGPVRIESVLDAAIGMAKNQIKHRARLVTEYAEVPAVIGNEGRLGQVFLNLLVNAAHAIPVGAADQNEIRVSTREEGDRVVVEVRDTGSGIAAENLSRLFEPFFTTKPVGQGTGLGLAICRDIVLKLGGSIEVESTVGVGTVFRVLLPRSADAAPPRAVTSDHVQVPVPRPLRVLVVDDEELIGRVVRRCFGKTNEVQWIGSGREAAERLAGPEDWDVVFLDVMMPEMTGMEVFEHVRQHAPQQLEKIVFLTGGAFAAGGEEFLVRTGRPRISKPFEPRDLLGAAAEIVGRAST
ncbi:MAG: PAS domain S-box protein [Myxococcales bacterium]|nr:PAS domain S-box protein [Myxococcales bacterium]